MTAEQHQARNERARERARQKRLIAKLCQKAAEMEELYHQAYPDASYYMSITMCSISIDIDTDKFWVENHPFAPPPRPSDIQFAITGAIPDAAREAAAEPGSSQEEP